MRMASSNPLPIPPGPQPRGAARDTGTGARDAGRRDLLAGAMRLAAASLAASLARAAGAATQPARFDADPFSLGVASGAPEPDGFVIWTRLVPDPARADGGLPPVPYELRWEVAADEGFSRIVAGGRAVAHPELAHSLRVEVRGLAPGRWYHYRFFAGDGAHQASSPVGRARTAPAPDVLSPRLRLAVASCQQYEQGYFGAYRHMADEDLDLVLFVGDYIYESSWGRDPVRAHRGAEPKTLGDYRIRHAQYRGDADLQRMHAAAPWIVTWDDHEVDNDYAGDRSEDLDPRFLVRRAAAYRAYFEHMPLRAAALPDGAAMRIHGRHRFGRLAELFVLDSRQYRTPQACPKPRRGGGNIVAVERCPELFDPRRSMLGSAQERWLDRCFSESAARWNLIGQQTLFSQLTARSESGTLVRTDGWSAYPAARRRLIDSMRAHRLANPLVLGGDVHANWVCDVKADFDDARSETVATEFCATSITSQGPAQVHHDRARSEHAHVHLAESEHRGYVVVELKPDLCTTTLRTVDDVRRPDPAIATRARFVVDSGRPGAVLD